MAGEREWLISDLHKHGNADEYESNALSHLTCIHSRYSAIIMAKKNKGKVYQPDDAHIPIVVNTASSSSRLHHKRATKRVKISKEPPVSIPDPGVAGPSRTIDVPMEVDLDGNEVQIESSDARTHTSQTSVCCSWPSFAFSSRASSNFF